MRKRLLLIDDDIWANEKEAVPGAGAYMWYYADALRDRGYVLTEVNSIDRALEVLGIQQFDLILLDVMMPPGKALAEADTAAGMRTGVVFADHLAKAYPDMPVVILTMVANPSALNLLRNKPNVKEILYKIDNPPNWVAEAVGDILGE
jgi:CheY-like chemotaxis protein